MTHNLLPDPTPDPRPRGTANQVGNKPTGRPRAGFPEFGRGRL